MGVGMIDIEWDGCTYICGYGSRREMRLVARNVSLALAVKELHECTTAERMMLMIVYLENLDMVGLCSCHDDNDHDDVLDI